MRKGERQKSFRRNAPASGARWSRAGDTGTENLLIFGVHAVEAALANPNRTVRKVFLTDNAERRMRTVLAERGIVREPVTPRDLDRRLGPDTVHQGALIEVAPLREPKLEDLSDRTGSGPLILLDQVTDPHNVGAILRSAAAFGAAGLVTTRRHSPPLGGALAKAASGAVEHVPIALVQNLARAIDDLKGLGLTVIGLDGEAADGLESAPWPEHAAIVLGAEGRGLRQLTRTSCDRLVRIATAGNFGSLNVSNAAAVALHWAAVSRLKLLGAGARQN